MPMDTDRKLLEQYLELARTEEGSLRAQELAPDFDSVSDICRHDGERAWRLILLACERALTNQEAAFFAAGPIEDFLVYYGAQFIDRIEHEATINPHLNFLLGGVWKNTIEESVWQRVVKVRKTRW